MNITELKELAEKATPGPWEWDGDVSNYDPENEAPWLAQAPWTSRDSKNVLMGTIKAVRAEDAAYIAAANPAAILELIAQLEDARTQMERQKDEWLSWEAKRRDLEKAAAQLEDAQGEIRALRATEAGLRERVKELEEALSDCVLDSRQAVSDHIAKFGEKWRPASLANLRETVSKADALLEKKE